MKRVIKKYKGISLRLSGWDYGQRATYFITLTLQNRLPTFGRVTNGTVHLSQAGEIAKSNWENIPQHFEFVYLDEFIVMPDHMHGIITIISNKSSGKKGIPADRKLQSEIGKQMSIISPKKGTLSSVIRSYKSSVTKLVRKEKGMERFKWQKSYWDQIVWSDVMLGRIRKYIQDNPKNWNQD